MAGLGPTELLLILLVVLLLFGAKRLPDLSRSVGRSLRILKSETKALHEDEAPVKPSDAPDSAPTALPAATTLPPTVTPTATPTSGQVPAPSDDRAPR